MEHVPPALPLLSVPAHTLGPWRQVSGDASADRDCPAPNYDPQPTEKGSHSVIHSSIYSVIVCAGSHINKVAKIPCFRGAYALASGN